MILDGSEFALDSLFCEWGYLIDLDQERLEVYRGFQQSPHDVGRFAGREGRDGYAPVALIASWPLSELPSEKEFLAVDGDEDEDE